jgi:signal transduction histidine kinase
VLDQNERMVQELEQGEQALRRNAEDLRKLSLQLGEAEDRERRHLAAILHDDIQQLMAGAKFQLETVSRFVDERGRKPYESAMAVLLEAIEKTRSLSHELNPPILREKGLLAALVWLADNMWTLHRLRVECDVQTDRQPEDEQVRGFVFRAVKELFFNITKHADRNQARMEARREEGSLVIAVTDPGRGFDVSRTMEQKDGGLGLAEIRRRAGTLGARLDIESTPGNGSGFDLRVPLRPV